MPGEPLLGGLVLGEDDDALAGVPVAVRAADAVELADEGLGLGVGGLGMALRPCGELAAVGGLQDGAAGFPHVVEDAGEAGDAAEDLALVVAAGVVVGRLGVPAEDVVHPVRVIGGARSNHRPFGMMILIFAFEMGLEGQRESRRGREEALLEDERHQVAGAGLGRARLGAAGGGVELEQFVGLALGVGVGDVDRVDRAGGEALGAVGVLDVGLEAADHDLVECGLVRFHALEEALRVEHLQERLPRPRVAVVRGRGQEEMVLAVLGEPSDRLRLLALDRVAVGLRRLGGGAVVDLVDDQQVEEAGESAFRS